MAEATATPTDTTKTGSEGTTSTGQTGTGEAGTTAGAQATAAGEGSSNQTTQPVVPEKYDLKAPDGVTVTEESVTEFQTYAKALKLTQEQASSLFERSHKQETAILSRFGAQHEQKVTKWAESVTADPEIGGEGFAQNQARAQQMLTKYGTPEFRKILAETGFGNHPELVRFVVRVGKQFGEDHFENPGSGGGRPEKKSAAELLYGSPPKT